jgi:hypothetical protein
VLKQERLFTCNEYSNISSQEAWSIIWSADAVFEETLFHN